MSLLLLRINIFMKYVIDHKILSHGQCIQWRVVDYLNGQIHVTVLLEYFINR